VTVSHGEREPYKKMGYGDYSSEDDEREIDLDEIKREINNSIGRTLSKYFK
jgi:hypothetical protein